MRKDPVIRLNLPTEPYWLDLPPGVRLHVRPLDEAGRGCKPPARWA